MIRKACLWAMVLCLVLLSSSALQAQARKHSWEAGYFAGVNFYGNELKLSNESTYGLRLGFNLTPGFELEVSYATSDDSVIQTDFSTLIPNPAPPAFAFKEGIEITMDSINLRAVGNFSNEKRRWKPFIFAGMGRHDFTIENSDLPEGGNDGGTTASVGAGTRFFFTDYVAARMEASIEYAITDIYWNQVVTVGLVGLFGGGEPADEDGDGTSNVHDACTETPLGAYVDRVGCPFDLDLDGIFNGIDECRETPGGWPVDERGCPTDVDGDSVPDGQDTCDKTPKGALVDEQGCPLDTDQDGIFDGLDQCTGTLFGARVDLKGCALDEDKDGVPDGIDQCPQTPKGAVVDDKGCPSDGDGDQILDGLDECPDTPSWWTLDEKGCPTPRLDRLVLVILEQVNFEVSSSALKPEATSTLDRAVSALSYWSDVKVEIGGYTDNRGADWFNQQLSLDRAKTVKQYFVDRGIDASRLDVKGYGPLNPVADNTTEDGRGQNRRVEMKKSGGDESLHPPLSSHAPPPASPTPPPAMEPPADPPAEGSDDASADSDDSGKTEAAKEDAPAPDTGGEPATADDSGGGDSGN